MAKKKEKKLSKKLEKNFISVPGIKTDGDLIDFFTQHVGKDGRWKGSKKLLKKARPSCPHNTYKNRRNRTGKNPWIGKGGRCSICGEKIKLSFYRQSEVEDAYEKTAKIASQAALINQAVDGGKNTTNFIASVSMGMNRMPKLYKDLTNVASKREKVKGKKKKKKNQGEYGSWEMN